MSAFRLFVVCGLLSLLPACSGVGKGNKPKSLVVLQIPAGRGLTQEQVLNPPAEYLDFTAYSCVGGSLRAFVVFDDDSIGDFTTRVRWSSNSADLKVSNFDVPTSSGEGTVFGSGTLVPVATAAVPATVRITASYLGMEAVADVALRGASDAIVEPTYSQVPFETAVRPVFRAAPGSLVNFRVRRVLDGKGLTDVSSTTVLTIENDDDGDLIADSTDETDTDRYGVLDSTGTLTVRDADTDFDRDLKVVSDTADDVDDDGDLSDLDEGGSAAPPLTLLATPLIPGCAAAQVVVQGSKIAPGDLSLEYQKDFYGAGPTGHLAENSSQALRLVARFVDDNSDTDRDDEGEYQVVSNQLRAGFAYDRDADSDCDVVDLDPALTNPSPAYPEAMVRFGAQITRTANFVTAIADATDDGLDEPTTICARYGASASPNVDLGYPAKPGVLSNTLPLTVIDGPLTAMTVAASDPCTAEVKQATLCTELDPPISDPLNPSLRAGKVLQFNAQGTFTADGGASLTQPITSLVSWTTSDAAKAVIGAVQATSLAQGQLVALTGAEGSVTVTARFVRGAVDTSPATASDPTDEVVEIPLALLPAEDP